MTSVIRRESNRVLDLSHCPVSSLPFLVQILLLRISYSVYLMLACSGFRLR